jgi:hypothetical protein
MATTELSAKEYLELLKTPEKLKARQEEIKQARIAENQRYQDMINAWRVSVGLPVDTIPVSKKPQKTIAHLVQIARAKSKEISTGCLRLGSNPSMKVPYPLRRVILQNCTASHITQMLRTENNKDAPIDKYEHYEPQFQLPRQPATDVTM